MSELSPPVVKLPEATRGKEVAPGTNSWAQTIEQQKVNMKKQEDLRATHRERYENKPVPPPPTGESVNSSHRRLPSKPYIQPAIPLVDPSQNPKSRAVTDPVASKAMFAARKPSVTQLRKKISNSKSDPSTVHQSEPALPSPSSKAAQILGMYPATSNKRVSPPSSAPQVSNIHTDDCFSSTGSFEDSRTHRQTQSTPMPSRPSIRSNEVPAFCKDGGAAEHNIREREFEAVGHRTGSTQEPIGTSDQDVAAHNIPVYGNVPENVVQQKKGIHRIESLQAVVEHTSAASVSEAHINSGALDKSQSTTVHDRSADVNRPPTIYSPSNYGGVWENDPAVGYSLPPFSPFTKNIANDPVKSSGLPNHHFGNNGHRREQSTKPASITYQNSYCSDDFARQGHGRMADYQAPLPSANSWASGSRANSFESTNPSHWPDYHTNNSVPSPPHTQQDYQRPSAVPAGMAQLDLKLHHHIDTAFNALSRLVADKHDRGLDQIVRRIENLDHDFNRGFKNIRFEIQNFKKDVGNLQDSFRDIRKSSDDIMKLIGGLEEKLEGIEKKRISEQSCTCQSLHNEQRSSQQNNDRQQYRLATHRRTESAHGALGHGEQRPQYHGAASRSSSKGRPSETTGRCHRSSTLSSQIGIGVSDAEGSSKEDNVEHRSTKNHMPDLRDHPAYAHHHRGAGLVYDSDGLPLGLAVSNGIPYASQTLVNGGWYQQAYGQGH